MKKNHKQPFNSWTGRTLLAGLTLAGLPVMAQSVENLDVSADTDVAPAQTQQQGQAPSLPTTVTAGLAQQFDTDIDKNNGGSFSISRFMAGAMVPFRLNDQWLLKTGVRYQLDAYNFDVGNSSPIPTTWDNVNTLAGSAVLDWKANDNWSYYGGGLIKMSAESGADLGHAVTGGGLIGFNYKFDDTLTLGLGIAAVSQIERDAMVLPLITAKWKFADNWRLDVGLTDVATAGYGAQVTWLFSQEWDFGFGIQAHKSRFRIDGDPTTGTKDGVAQESSSNIYLNATWHASEKVDLSGFFGIAAGGKLRVDNSSGDKQFQSDYDPAAILGVKASVRF